MASRLLPNPSNAACVISMPSAGCNLPSSQNTTPQKFGGRRCQSPVAFAPPARHTRGAAGDTTTMDSRSQRNRASRRSGRLTTRALGSSYGSACPPLHCSRCLCPDGHTIRHDLESRSRTSAPRISYRLTAGQKEIPDVLDPITGHVPIRTFNAQVHCRRSI
jgi:hypothetical protein